MRNGIAYQLPPLVRLTDETDCGLWRTPDASVVTGGAANAEARKRQGHAIGLHDQVNTPSMWPTPTIRDWKDGSAESCSNVPVNALLGRAVHFPTPRACGGKNSSGAPRGDMYRAMGLPKVGVKGGANPTQVGGSLNPTWVEWLMGFPLGWTALEASATPSSRRFRKSSGGQS
jgi:hypothetical protein